MLSNMCETKSFYLWLLQVVALSGLLVFVLWLSLRPRSPSYTISDFSLPALSSQNAVPRADGDAQNATVSFELEIGNPNKDSVVYHDDINVTLYFEEESIGVTTISSFDQGKQQTDHFQKNVKASGRVWKAILGKVEKNKTAQFRVGLVGRVRHKVWFVKTRRTAMHMQGLVPIGSDGKIWGKKKKIKLHHGTLKRRLKGSSSFP